MNITHHIINKITFSCLITTSRSSVFFFFFFFFFLSPMGVSTIVSLRPSLIGGNEYSNSLSEDSMGIKEFVEVIGVDNDSFKSTFIFFCNKYWS